MRHTSFNLGPRDHRFPNAAKSQALRDEDAFMTLHGGSGGRWIYLAVAAVFSAPGAMRDRLASARRTPASPARTRLRGVPQPGAGATGP